MSYFVQKLAPKAFLGIATVCHKQKFSKVFLDVFLWKAFFFLKKKASLSCKVFFKNSFRHLFEEKRMKGERFQCLGVNLNLKDFKIR